MADYDGSVVVGITGDSTELDKELEKVTDTIKTNAATWETETNKAVTNVYNNATKTVRSTWQWGGTSPTDRINQQAEDYAQKRAAAAQDATDLAESTQQEMEETGNAVLDFLGGVGQGVAETLLKVFAAGKLTKMAWNYATDARDLAAALQQVNELSERTFGTHGAALVEQWANTSALSFGLTEASAKTYAVTFGQAMGETLEEAGYTTDEIARMSEQAVQRAADFAAANGIDFDSAYNKIINTIVRGGTQLAAFGIGVVGETDALSRYNSVMEQTADVTGAYAESADSYQNTMDRLHITLTEIQTTIGTALLPLFQGVSDALGKFLSIFLPGADSLEDQMGVINDTANAETAAVESTTASAKDLLGVLRSINEENGGDFLSAYAEDSGKLAASHLVWMTTCEKLIALIPELANVIDAETGSLTGGADAVGQAIDDYNAAQRDLITENMLAEKEALLNAKYAELLTQAREQELYARMAQNKYQELGGDEGLAEYKDMYYWKVLHSQPFDSDEQKQRFYDLRDLYKKYKEYQKIADDMYKEISPELADYQKERAELDELKKTYQETMDSMDASDMAEANGLATGKGVAAGLQAAEPEIQAEVDTINAILSEIALPYGYSSWDSYISDLSAYYGGSIPGFASGLDYVPKDNYFALLHTGESVLTAEEARVWRNLKYGDAPADYDAMGRAVGAYMPNFGGMQVVWRGRVVADILSEMQGDSYRALDRSGWTS